MVSFDELNEQNHKISELTQVIMYLIKDRSICDSEVTCALFFDLTDKIKDQLDMEERELYKDLLTHKDQELNVLANEYLSSSVEFKRKLKSYIKYWCHNKSLRIKNHDDFLNKTDELFSIMQDRIVNVTENLYPLVKKINSEKVAA